MTPAWARLAKDMPGPLPAGERLLWQGAPTWRGVARHVLHVRWVAAYFAALLAWTVGSSLAAGTPAASVAVSTGRLAALALVPILLIAAYAWGLSRTSAYAITNRRVLIRTGIALPATVNLPFSVIDAAAVKQNADGSGDIAMTMVAGSRASYLMLWPHLRPWRLGAVQPAFRAVPDAAQAAQVLGRALAAAADLPVQVAPAPMPAAARPGPRAAAA